MTVKDLLKIAIEKNASDLHLKVGNHPVIRIDGKLTPLTNLRRLTSEDTVHMANEIMNEYQRKKLQEQFDVDLAYSVPGFGRFRGNVFYQRGTIGIVLRIIPLKVKTIRELLLPAILEKISLEQRGLVLVTGTTGSGKSTTLAAMIDYINTHRTENIVTIEDPIEFIHRDKKSIINQREVGLDAESFSRGLISSLRQDPDVILVGEMRDFETIETAILAAETGHLVLSTLHTLDAPETVNRIIAVYPPYQQKQIRLQLASLLKAAISMRLLPRADVPGRAPAVEVMVNTPFIRDCIINKEKTHLIRDAIAAGVSQYGMQTFDQSLYKLYINKYISLDQALRYASNPDNFRLKVMGIQTTTDMALEEMEKKISVIGDESESEDEGSSEEIE
ncbi:MAG: type IV pilus twitching motility protein PilT [Candidatus Aminicenantia bacterium]